MSTVATGAAITDDLAMNHENPFPGLNPYMERRWGDVHVKLTALIAMELGTELPQNYSAIGEQQVDVKGGESKRYSPDVMLVDESWKQGLPPVWKPDSTGGSTAPEPLIVEVGAPPERWVEIRHDDGDLVTVIEVISPTNRGSGRLEFESKRKDYIAAGVSVVEIDLLRAGKRLIDLGDKSFIQRFGKDEATTVCTIRSGFPSRREVYLCPLREPLKSVRIPLRHPDPDVVLNLQQLVNRVYITGRYWKLDFTKPLDPPLNDEDQAWANERLQAAGLLG